MSKSGVFLEQVGECRLNRIELLVDRQAVSRNSKILALSQIVVG